MVQKYDRFAIQEPETETNLAVSVASIASYVQNNNTSFYFTSTTGSQATSVNAPNILGNNAQIYGTVIYVKRFPGFSKLAESNNFSIVRGGQSSSFCRSRK